MGHEPHGTFDGETMVDDTVETMKARIFAALNAMSPGDIRSLVEEIETEVKSEGPK